MDKRFDIPWTRLSRPLGALFGALDFATSNEQEEIIEAWRHCVKRGEINGRIVSEDVRKVVGAVAHSINTEIKLDARTYVRREITKTLIDRAKR